MCARAGFVVISVDYRLAPEYPWPAAVHDAWEALLWTSSDLGISKLGLDPSKLAIGGSSAGGNLAAIMCHKSAALPKTLPIFIQLLIVPVTDNTATPATNKTYSTAEFTAALPAEKMLWYRRHYLPNEKDWANPEASPLFYEDAWEKQPKKALILVAELDVLREEGEQYGQKLEEAGVNVHLEVMKGMPHPFLAMDGSLTAGKQAITLMAEALKRSFE